MSKTNALASPKRIAISVAVLTSLLLGGVASAEPAWLKSLLGREEATQKKEDTQTARSPRTPSREEATSAAAASTAKWSESANPFGTPSTSG